MYLSHSVALYYTSVEFPGNITVNRDTGQYVPSTLEKMLDCYIASCFTVLLY